MKGVQHPTFLKRSIVGTASVESTCLKNGRGVISFSLVGFSFVN